MALVFGEILELQVVWDSQERLVPLDKLVSRDQQEQLEVQEWWVPLDLRGPKELLGH